MAVNFTNLKKEAFQGLDLSRKGSVDEPIENLVAFINSLDQYFTTSSCSGRILLIGEDYVNKKSIQKEGCKWIHVTHSQCNPGDIVSKLDPTNGDLTFKFEPFVLHVQCKSLDDAQIMLSCGVQAGFRNSGISLKSRKSSDRNFSKIIVAIRSTHGLDTPLSANGELLVSEKFVDHITSKANRLMEENLKRIARFYENLTCSVKKSEEKE